MKMMKDQTAAWTSLAAVMGIFALAQSFLNSVLPPEIRAAASKLYRRLIHCFSPYCYYDIVEGDGVSTNELYSSVQLYLSSSTSDAGNRITITRAPNSSTFTFSLSGTGGDRLFDTFAGATAAWEHVVTQRQSSMMSPWRHVPEEKRSFALRIAKKDKPILIPAYLDHIMSTAEELRRRSQDRLLYTNSGRGGREGRGGGGYPWESVPFKHPSTFDTLAMDPARKEEIMADLRNFAADGKSFYQRTGRAWKRGYLLYGPPGTGKSSMIAAMSNYLGYDVYDLELSDVLTNSDLRKLLMKTTSKSIIVIEDIDCSINLSKQRQILPPEAGRRPTPPPEDDDVELQSGGGSVMLKTITLSGLLNFTDGLWSCCGSERIFVFTTNHIDKLDPALLRPGRMDMHIFMSVCSFPALKILMKNYLGLVDEELADDRMLLPMRELEEAVEAAEMTPADVSETLTKSRRLTPAEAAGELLQVLRSRAEARKISNVVAAAGTKGSSMLLLPMKKTKKVDELEEEDDQEEEEQEKRALDSPKIDCEAQVPANADKEKETMGEA